MHDTAVALAAPRSFALSEHRQMRFVTIFLLYVAQGLPFGLIDLALPAWLAQSGASAAAIGGVLAMAILPWTFKLAYGLVMDRYAFLAMGRRRPWIIIGQLGIVIGLLAMALVNPAAHQISLIAAFAFIVGLSSAVQDVAVDGLAVDVLPAGEIERVNGYMFGGQAIGVAIGGALGGTLIAYNGLRASLLALSVITTLILMLVIIVRERPGERLLPWTKGVASQRNLDLQLNAFGPIVRNLLAAMFTRQTLILIPALILATAAWGIFLGLAPLFATRMLGWEKDIYSGWSSQAFLVAGLFGGLAFGVAAERWGATRMFILCALMAAAAALAMLVGQAQWDNPTVFVVAIFGLTALTMLRAITSGAMAMRLCTPAIAATQFAVFMAINNLGRTVAAGSLGWLDSLGGIPAMFTAMAVCSLAGAIFAFAAKVGR
jgi:PAT family beta-lactamase induction signal transducer AmpG